jgi:hypothetical protein
MPRSKTKTLRNKLDKEFSLAVRERAGWCCEACGKSYFDNRSSLQCSHHFSRRFVAIRWDWDNASAHCAGCHMHLGGNPIEFAEWIQNKIGPEKVQRLRELKETSPRYREADYQELLEKLRREANGQEVIKT